MCYRVTDLTCFHLTYNPLLGPRSLRHRCLPEPRCLYSFASFSLLFLSQHLFLPLACSLHLSNKAKVFEGRKSKDESRRRFTIVSSSCCVFLLTVPHTAVTVITAHLQLVLQVMNAQVTPSSAPLLFLLPRFFSFVFVFLTPLLLSKTSLKHDAKVIHHLVPPRKTEGDCLKIKQLTEYLFFKYSFFFITFNPKPPPSFPFHLPHSSSASSAVRVRCLACGVKLYQPWTGKASKAPSGHCVKM